MTFYGSRHGFKRLWSCRKDSALHSNRLQIKKTKNKEHQGRNEPQKSWILIHCGLDKLIHKTSVDPNLIQLKVWKNFKNTHSWANLYNFQWFIRTAKIIDCRWQIYLSRRLEVTCDGSFTHRSLRFKEGASWMRELSWFGLRE